MISFTNLWAPLLACFLAAALVIIWLLRRLLIPRRIFPPLLWILKAKGKFPVTRIFSAQFQLAFAVLSILLLGFFFGRPVIGEIKGATRAVIIILDCSLSMSAGRDTSLFSQGRRIAGNILTHLGDGDKANLALAGTEITWAYPHASVGLDLTPLWQLLENADATYGTGMLADAIRLGKEKLNKINYPEKRIYIISDFQKTSFRDVRADPVPGITLIPLRAGPLPKNNIAIRPAERAAFFGFTHEPIRVSLEIENFSGSMRRVEVKWRVNNTLIEKLSYDIPQEKQTKITKIFSFQDPGIYESSAEVITDDALTKDNIVYFSLTVKDRCRVAVASTQSPIRRLVIKALGGNDQGPINAVAADNTSFSGCDAIISMGASPPMTEAAIRNGMPCILFAGPSTALPRDGPRSGPPDRWDPRRPGPRRRPGPWPLFPASPFAGPGDRACQP